MSGADLAPYMQSFGLVGHVMQTWAVQSGQWTPRHLEVHFVVMHIILFRDSLDIGRTPPLRWVIYCLSVAREIPTQESITWLHGPMSKGRNK